MLKKIAYGFLALLTAICIFFCFALFGNPVSKMLVTKNAKQYIQLNYSDDKYAVDSVKYDFKTSYYYVIVKAPDSADKNFTLYAGMNGKISFDTYESAVENKCNTAGRINDEYRSKVDEALNSDDFGYTSDIAFGDIEFTDKDRSEGEDAADFAISTDTLTLDGEYDIYEMGKKAGCLTVYISDDEVSAEKMSEILVDIKALADKKKIGFCAIDCVLEYPLPEDGTIKKEGRVEVMSFSYADIYKQGLTERVRLADKKAKEYYARMDSLKQATETGS